MRETLCLGTSLAATVSLLACIACPTSIAAQAPANPAAAEPVLPAGPVTREDDGPLLADPTADLPRSLAPQIEGYTLFPNHGEMKAARLDDQRFGYVLHGEAKAVYESNVFIRSRNEQEDFYFTISPGLAIGWGEFKGELYGAERPRFENFAGKSYIYVDYAPSYTWWVDHSDLDSFDHHARLEAEWMVERLMLGVSASYVTEIAPVEDLGTRVERRRLLAALTSSYELSGKAGFEINGYYEGNDYEGDFVDSQEWRNEDWFNYRVSPKVKLGLGATFAGIDREDRGEQTYEQGRLRIICEPSESLTLSLIGGAEWRQTDGDGDQAFGIFQLDAAWTPLDGTYLYLQGFRRSVTTGSNDGEYYIATGVYALLRQRVFHRYYVSLTVGYQNADYQLSESASGTGRSDDLLFIRPGVGLDLAAWLNCEVSGEYRRNDSTIDRRSFDAAKATVRFNVLF
jgi:hypothetical protein